MPVHKTKSGGYKWGKVERHIMASLPRKSH